MPGIAFSLNPRHWRFGRVDAYDDVLDRVVGTWLCFGLIAFTYDYE